MTTKQMKLNELKAMVRAWKREKSMAVAYEICEFLANNLDLEGGAMKAKLTKTSDWEFEKKVDVETIDDVLKYHNKVVLKKADELTKSDDKFADCEIEIEIYDDWRE